MPLRVGLLIVGTWIVVAVPLALLIGRVLASADRPVAEGAAAYLRREHRRAVLVPRLQRTGALAGLLGVTLVVTGILDAPARVPVERASTAARHLAAPARDVAREEGRRIPTARPRLAAPAVATRGLRPASAPGGVGIAATTPSTPAFPPAIAPWLASALGFVCADATAVVGLPSPCPAGTGAGSPPASLPPPPPLG